MRMATGGECSGFFWSLHPEQGGYKDSITMVELMHLAARLAATPGSPPEDAKRYLQRAQAIWRWIFAFDGGEGLLTDGVMSTGAVPAWCCSSSSAAAAGNGSVCANSRVAGMSYNHGLLLSTAAVLHNITAAPEYHDRAHALLAAAVANLTNREGGLRDVQRGAVRRTSSPPARPSRHRTRILPWPHPPDRLAPLRSQRSQRVPCNASDGHDPGADFFSFKGIFAAHAAYTAHYFASGLSESQKAQLLRVIEVSSAHAWARAAVWPPFPTDDVCSVNAAPAPPPAQHLETSTSAAAANDDGHSPAPGFSTEGATTPPKFRWWWSSSVEAAVETPPDPRLWLGKDSLSCAYPPSLWIRNGTSVSLAQCEAACAAERNCTKFVWVGSVHRCRLLAPYLLPDRSTGPRCAHLTGSYVGARRPANPAARGRSSCAGRCPGDRQYSSDSVVDETPPPCRCDAACTRHLDCCLDYADVCIAPNERTPSCSGRCWVPPEPPAAHGLVSRDRGAPATNDRTGTRRRGHGVAEAADSPSASAAIAIPGGGYCFCDVGCRNKYTDNNSEGSCCADFEWRCAGGEQDPLCMDARTQAQALHLFAAHALMEGSLSTRS